MNLSKVGKKVWWGFLVLATTVVVSFRLKPILSGDAAQIDFYLLFLWVGLLLTPLFSEVDILGVKLKKETAETKESASRQKIQKNHIHSIRILYRKEPDLLKLQRCLFAAIQIAGLTLLIMNNYRFGAPLVLAALGYGEFFYKPKALESRENNKGDIIAYFKHNNIYNYEKLSALSNLFLARSQEPPLTNTKVSFFLTALLAPYYWTAVKLFFTEKEWLIAFLPAVLGCTLVFLTVILHAAPLLGCFLWFLSNAQQVNADISRFISEEVMSDCKN